MAEDAPVRPGLSPVAGKPLHVAFDGGRLTSDGGVLVLAEIDRRLGLAERPARCLADPRAPERVHHTLAEMIRFRTLLIAAGYPDANDCDGLRTDPAFKLAVGRLPESGADLCSQPTMSRLENLPGPTALKRMMAALVELFCDSFAAVPRRIVLDIDDTEDRVHGRQQLSAFHAHYDSRCFLPIHIYEAVTGRPVAVILRPGKTPDGAEVARVLRHVIRRIRARWPRVEILVRGDGHYGRPEAMSWCERHRVGYAFGLAGNKVLLARVARLAEDAALGRVGGEGAKVRRYGEFRYAAGTWDVERRVVARVEASDRGTDSRFVVTDIAGAPRWLYAAVSCTALGAGRKIWSRRTSATSPRTGPPAPRPRPTSSGWCCTPPPIGCCTPYAAWPRRGRSGVTPSSTRSARR
jgi:Transposase DDE domain group 1